MSAVIPDGGLLLPEPVNIVTYKCYVERRILQAQAAGRLSLSELMGS